MGIEAVVRLTPWATVVLTRAVVASEDMVVGSKKWLEAIGSFGDVQIEIYRVSSLAEASPILPLLVLFSTLDILRDLETSSAISYIILEEYKLPIFTSCTKLARN